MKTKLNCILVIDDDEPTNFITNMLLEDADCTHRIQIEESGQKALDYLSGNDPGAIAGSFPELIFVDINMPAMNGWEFLELYRELKPRYPNTIIIMLTTSINPDDRWKADNMPLVNGFETKPLTDDKINLLMQKYFLLPSGQVNSL